jgi:glycosyltransferase involved in cell wall biosynthesis
MFSGKKVLIVYNRFPSIAEDLKQAFEHVGVRADIFYSTDYRSWFYQKIIRPINRLARSLRLIPKGTDLFKHCDLNFINYITLNFKKFYQTSQPDFLLFIHGIPFGNELLKDIDIPKVGWWLEPSDHLPELIKNSTSFDIYNSFSQESVDLLLPVGVDARYLAHAVTSEKFFTTEQTKIYDVVFVGNWSPWRDDVLEAACQVTDRIALYGPQWLKKSKLPKDVLKKIYRGPEILGRDLNQLFNQARVVLNASRIKASHGLNMRFFEVAGAGGLLLTDPVNEIGKHFKDGSELVVYEDVEDLKVKLAQLLGSPDMASKISKNGQHIVLGQHTYQHLAHQFLLQFEEIMKKKIKPSS